MNDILKIAAGFVFGYIFIVGLNFFIIVPFARFLAFAGVEL